MLAGRKLDKAYVNNGGDSALHLAAGQSMRLAIAGTGKGFADRVVIRAEDAGARRGDQRLARAQLFAWHRRRRDGAGADGRGGGRGRDDHRQRGRPAWASGGHARAGAALAPDSDLGDRLVTTDVGRAVAGRDGGGAGRGDWPKRERLRRRGLIEAAALFLDGETRVCGALAADRPAPYGAPLKTPRLESSFEGELVHG